MQSLRVLVVEDEQPLLQELSELPWESFGASLCGTASNGLDAWCHFDAPQIPDVVLTDITMPIMDGIELMHKIKQKYPHVQVVLLTCHLDFHYAQEAIQAGALDYLIKISLCDKEIEQVLDKARKTLLRERAHTRLLWEKELHQLQSARLSGALQEMQLETKRKIEAHLPAMPCYIMLHLPHASMQMAEPFVSDFFFEEIQRTDLSIDVFLMRKNEYLLLTRDKEINIHATEHPIFHLLQRLQAAITVEIPHICSFSVLGSRLETAFDLVQFMQCIPELQRALFYTDEWQHTVQHQAILSGMPQAAHPIEQQDLLHIETKKQKICTHVGGIKHFLQHEFTEWARSDEFDVSQVKQMLVTWVTEWQRDFHLFAHLEAIIEDILASIKLMDAVRMINDNISMDDLQSIGGHIEVRHAQRIILENLASNLTLEFVAAKVSLSPTYLSRIFRQETGETFNGYMTRCRIESAMKLLRTTNLMVYEVAVAVGIPNYRYFSRVFRQWTGSTPKEYKRGLAKQCAYNG